METTSTSTSTRNTTSEPPNSYTTVTVTLTLTLRNTVLPYRTAVTEFTVYVAHARARRERRALATAPGSGRGSRRTASIRTGFELAGSVCSRFPCHVKSFIFLFLYLRARVRAARCALPAVRSRAQGRSRPPWSMWTMHPHLDQSRRRVTLPASAHATALLRRPGALPRWSCTAQAPPSSARPNGLARALGYRYLIRKVPNLEGAPSLVPLGSCPLSPPRSSFVRLPRFASPVPRSPLRTAQAFVSPGGGALRDPSISRKWRSSRACACECAESDWVAPRMACTIASARCCTARISFSLLA